jgi:hypothetical protein
MTPPWSKDEDDLLFSLLHSSNLGGCDMIANMNEQASGLGIEKRRYNMDSLFNHYRKFIQPRMEARGQTSVGSVELPPLDLDELLRER